MATNALSKGKTEIKLTDLTPKWLKDNYLTGLTFCDADGKELPNEFFETHMMNAVRRIEGIANISILEKVLTAEEHDYRVGDYQMFAFLQLFHFPVKRVEAVRAVYPLGLTIQDFPKEWFRVEESHGQLHLVPSRGSLGQIILGQGGDFLPLIYSGLSYLPHLWEIDYVAGMDECDMPRDVVEAIAKYASIEILTIMSDLIRPIGVSSESVSLDGMSQSQSFQLPAFQQRINRYIFDLYGIEGKQQDLKTTSGLLKHLYDQFHGFNLASLY